MKKAMGTLLETKDLVTNFYTYEGVVKALNKVSIIVDHGSTFGLVGPGDASGWSRLLEYSCNLGVRPSSQQLLLSALA